MIGRLVGGREEGEADGLRFWRVDLRLAVAEEGRKGGVYAVGSGDLREHRGRDEKGQRVLPNPRVRPSLEGKECCSEVHWAVAGGTQTLVQRQVPGPMRLAVGPAVAVVVVAAAVELVAPQDEFCAAFLEGVLAGTL